MGWIAAVGKRGGGITQPDPPGGFFYGPLAGPQAVRDGTIPQSVNHPGGSPTVVNPGDPIATRITQAGAGGTLWFTKGTHVNTSRKTPLAGQTFVFESASGYNRSAADSAVLDGQNANFEAHFMSGVNNVTFRGGVLMRQGNSSTLATWAGAIVAEDGASGWLIEDLIAKDNWNRGINVTCDGVVRRCYSTNNGRYGMNVQSNVGDGLVVEKCRISHNNARELLSGGDASGTKFAAQSPDNFRLRDNWVHDNRGFGLWIDVPNISGGHWITGNVCENNWRAGIFLEGAMGGSKIQRNYCINNGKDYTIGGHAPASTNNVQLFTTNSDQTLGSGIRGDISQNDVDFTRTPTVPDPGMLILLWSHDAHPGRVKNWDVHNNRMWIRRTTDAKIVGGHDTATSGTEVWAGDNDFYDNEYHVANTGASYWEWDTGTGQGVTKNYAQWQTFHPADNDALIPI